MLEENTEQTTPKTENTENDTPTNEGGQDTNPETESSPEPDELAKTKEAYENQKIRAEKAEKELKDLKAKESQTPKKQGEAETPKKEEESNEPDYAKEAFLEQRGVQHADDKKIVYDEANRLKLPLTDILGMEHIKTKLKSASEQREAEAGMPDSKGKPSGSNKGSEDYWIDRKNKDGSFQNPKDPELHQKVIKKRMEKEQKGNEFDPIR